MSETSAPLLFHKHADKTSGERLDRWDELTGEKKLVNPHTEGSAHESWPLAGVSHIGPPPAATRVATSYITDGIAEGWIETEGGTPVHRPGGPPTDPWRVTHTFIHYDAIVFKLLDGDLRYRVVHQPDKYAVTDRIVISEEKGLYAEVIDPDKKVTDKVYAAGDTRVDHFYDLTLEA